MLNTTERGGGRSSMAATPWGRRKSEKSFHGVSLHPFQTTCPNEISSHRMKLVALDEGTLAGVVQTTSRLVGGRGAAVRGRPSASPGVPEGGGRPDRVVRPGGPALRGARR